MTSTKRVVLTMDHDEYLRERDALVKFAQEAERARIDGELLEITKCSTTGVYGCNWPKRNIIRHIRMALKLDREDER